MKEKADILILKSEHKLKAMRPDRDYLQSVWDFFTSIKLSVILLLILAATSIIGTVIPQNKAPEEYLQAFGEGFYKIFNAFDFFDMYHSWWFQFLILMLVVNIIVCSIHRLSAIWKIVFVRKPPFNIGRFRKISNKEDFTNNRSPEVLVEIYKRFVSKRFGYVRIEETDKGLCIFAEKWRWTRLGVYTVHLSVLFLLLGGLVGSLFGFEGYINIPEGEAINSIKLRHTGQTKDLGFEVRCDAFNVTFYDSGSPKEFRSRLMIMEDGKPVLQKDIIVNDPLRYKGINFFQSSYGQLPPKELTLSLASSVTGKTYQQNVAIGQQIDLPEGMGKLIVKGFRNAADFRGHQIGKAFLGTLTPKDGAPVFILLPLRYPSFDTMRKGKVMISVSGFKQHYYTGLQVSNAPGVFVVYTGFIVMIVGIFITFFMSHQRLCIEIRKSGEKSSIMVTGTANKNKLGMRNKIKKISRRLADLEQSP